MADDFISWRDSDGEPAESHSNKWSRIRGWSPLGEAGLCPQEGLFLRPTT